MWTSSCRIGCHGCREEYKQRAEDFRARALRRQSQYYIAGVAVVTETVLAEAVPRILLEQPDQTRH
jgi:hypothetical protein